MKNVPTRCVKSPKRRNLKKRKKKEKASCSDRGRERPFSALCLLPVRREELCCVFCVAGLPPRAPVTVPCAFLNTFEFVLSTVVMATVENVRTDTLTGTMQLDEGVGHNNCRPGTWRKPCKYQDEERLEDSRDCQ